MDTLLCASTDVDVREVTHMAVEDNDKPIKARSATATVTLTATVNVANMAIGEPEIIDLMGIAGVRIILELCDPRREYKSEAEFFQGREATTMFLS